MSVSLNSAQLHALFYSRWLSIFFLLLGILISGIETPSASSVPTHSNFFRAVYRGRQQVLWCGKDPNLCSKNPWGGGGAVCCFGKLCKDVMIDPNHCGGCGHVCGYHLVCCDGKCVNVKNDPRHCGGCFQECPGQGRCSYSMCDYGQ